MPFPMLTMQPGFTPGQIWDASSCNTLIGLLKPRPLSTYATGGLPICIGGKNIGAAEVARHACQIGQLSIASHGLL